MRKTVHKILSVFVLVCILTVTFVGGLTVHADESGNAYYSSASLESMNLFKKIFNVDDQMLTELEKWIKGTDYETQFPIVIPTGDLTLNEGEAKFFTYLYLQSVVYTFRRYMGKNFVDKARVILDTLVANKEKMINLLDAWKVKDLTLISTYIKECFEAFNEGLLDANYDMDGFTLKNFYITFHAYMVEFFTPVDYDKDLSFDYNENILAFDKNIFAIADYDLQDLDILYSLWLNDYDLQSKNVIDIIEEYSYQKFNSLSEQQLDTIYEKAMVYSMTQEEWNQKTFDEKKEYIDSSVYCGNGYYTNYIIPVLSDDSIDSLIQKQLVYTINTALTQYKGLLKSETLYVENFTAFINESAPVFYKVLDALDALTAHDNENCFTLLVEIEEDLQELIKKVFDDFSTVNPSDYRFQRQFATMQLYDTVKKLLERDANILPDILHMINLAIANINFRTTTDGIQITKDAAIDEIFNFVDLKYALKELEQNNENATKTIPGYGVPSNEIGKNGDIYIDLNDWIFYAKVNDVWQVNDVANRDNDDFNVVLGIAIAAFVLAIASVGCTTFMIIKKKKNG